MFISSHLTTLQFTHFSRPRKRRFAVCNDWNWRAQEISNLKQICLDCEFWKLFDFDMGMDFNHAFARRGAMVLVEDSMILPDLNAGGRVPNAE